jgi:hypothetical protein
MMGLAIEASGGSAGNKMAGLDVLQKLTSAT